MKFTTPFSVKDGFLYDRFFNRLELSAASYRLDSPKDVEMDFLNFFRNGIKLLRLEIDDSVLADAEGNISKGAMAKTFDEIVEAAFHYGIYLAIVPFTKGKLTARNPYSPEAIGRQQRYLGDLLTRKSGISGKRLYEQPHFALLEMLFDFDAFQKNGHEEGEEFDLYCGRVLMEPFLDHYLSHFVLKTYSLERGTPDGKSLKTMQGHAIKILDASVFTQKKDNNVKFESFMAGVQESVINGMIRQEGAKGWSNIVVSDATSIDEHPHQNGGAEGWLTYAAEAPVELRLQFPCEVKTAKFRPSMREKVKTEIHGNFVDLSFDNPRYGALEINYDSDLPAYTVYLLGDRIAEEPLENAKLIRPGFHKLEELDYGKAKTLHFMPGLHEIEGDKLPLTSGHDVCLARGAVVRAGVIAEKVQDAKLYGQGVLDGTSNPRDLGENKGNRMGEKWIEDAGREGFICFHLGKNIVFDGPVIYNSNFWNFVVSGTEDAVIRNHKAITWLQNTDGIQPRSCVNLLIERCFLKCADDCIAIKTRRTLKMESRNLVLKDLVLWHDRVGSGLQIGHTSQADLLEEVTFKDIEEIYGGNSGHVLGMCIIDHSTVRNVLYDGIYVEGRKFGCDFGFIIMPTYYTTDKERGRIQNVTVRNYFSEGEPLKESSFIKGFDEGHLIENVKFENLVWNYGDPKKQRRAQATGEFLKENLFSRNVLLE